MRWGQEEQDRLRDLLRQRSVKRGKVVLASGRTSDIYIDIKQTIFTPQGFALAGAGLYHLIRQTGLHCVGGLATGAVPLVGATLAASLDDATYPLNGFFVRPTAKGHGLNQQVEGCFDARQPVAILEDVVTTGQSALAALEAVRSAGGTGRHVFAVVDREEGGRATLESARCQLLSLFRRHDLA